MSKIQIGQCKELFGINTDCFFFLEIVAKNNPQIKESLENLKKTIKIFNSVGLEIDLSIRGDAVVFQESTE